MPAGKEDGAVLVLGGRSDIGGELAARICRGRTVVLAARPRGDAELHNAALDDAALNTTVSRLSSPECGASAVHRIAFDATDCASHRDVVRRAEQAAGEEVTTAIVAFGILGDQDRAERDEAHAADIAAVDYLAQVSMLTVLADVMPRGHIVAFSSIAGWRARRANYVYGSTKAGLDAFCQGLADRLHGSELALITARPGFVIGSMTEGMRPAPLSVTPDVVAEHIAKHMRADEKRSRPRSTTVWIPGTLRLLAWVMRMVPRPIWRHMPR